MSNTDSGIPANRAGRKHRSNPDRYFHIMTKGWYIFTREGVKGPFYDKSRATFYLEQHLHDLDEQPDPSTSWRL